MKQRIISASGNYSELDKYFAEVRCKVIFLVHGSTFSLLKIKDYFNLLESRSGIKIISFTDFQSNPLYESVEKGVKLFKRSGASLIVAVGGGSAIDVAKCIKLYSNMNSQKIYLEQEIVPNDVNLLAIPTTAGTGSESTRYAVIYYKGEKQSVTHESIIPDAVLFDPSCIETLPIYQKKATMLDALCHAIESFWSVNSTEESKKYSKQAIEMIFDNMDAYLENAKSGNEAMLIASNIAGKAINITQTTAGHAMCYKLTSLYGIAHGHAAALVDVKLFPYMLLHTEKCIDERGEGYLKQTLTEISKAMGCVSIKDATEKFQQLFDSLELYAPSCSAFDYELLTGSVNVERLKNNPILLDKNDINMLYHEILN